MKARTVPFISLALFLYLLCAPAIGTPSLNKGVNVYDWFQNSRSAQIQREDLNRLRLAGFDHIRIPFDPVFLGWNPERASAMLRIAELRAGVELALSVGLDVVLDMHPDNKTMQLIEEKPKAEQALISLWGEVARYFSPISADRLALELLNEPQYYDWTVLRWNELQKALFTTVRSNAPKHLILATGRRGGSPEGLAEVIPLLDDNVIYVFHFYLPYIFTHQGADWMTRDENTAAAFFDHLPYPPMSGPAPSMSIIPSNRRKLASREFVAYSAEQWEPAHIAKMMAPAIDWAKKHRKRVVCNEFGVLRYKVDSASRYRWLRDVRMALENNGVGWAVWGYTGNFGITQASKTNVESGMTIEPEAFSALNLTRRP